MTTGQKTSLSLLIATLVFGAFAVAGFSGLFNVLEARFYNPLVTRQYETSLAAIVSSVDTWHGLNKERFGAVLGADSLKRSFLPNISAQDAFDRANLLGKLQEETPGLAGVRLLDQDGRRIHFSTLPADLLRKTATETLFRDYGQSGDLPYADLAAPPGSKGELRLDPASGRFLYSLPFVDGFGVSRGTAIFLLSPSSLLDVLVRAGLLQVGEELSAAGAKGILLRGPAAGREALGALVAEAWAQGLGERPLTLGSGVPGPTAGAAAAGQAPTKLTTTTIPPQASATSWVLLSRDGTGGLRVGMLLPASSFVFPLLMKVLLLAVFFLTAFLLVFLVFNLRPERTVVLAERIKRYQVGLLEASFSELGERDLGQWKRQLETRRGEYRRAIKADLGKLGKAESQKADELLERSWDEILQVLGRRVDDQERIGAASIKEVERLITEALSRASFVLPAGSVVAGPPASAGSAAPAPAAKRAEPGPSKPVPAKPRTSRPPAVAEVEDFEEAEALEEIDDVEALEAAEAVEEIEEVEALEEAEAVEEIEEVEALEEDEAVEALEEAEAVEEIEDVEALEAAEAVEEIEEVEALEALAEPVSAEEVEDLVELSEAEGGSGGAPSSAVEELEELEEFSGEEGGFEASLPPASSYAFSSIDDDLVPLIPESSGLELSDEGELTDIMSFLDLGTDESETLDLISLEEGSEEESREYWVSTPLSAAKPLSGDIEDSFARGTIDLPLPGPARDEAAAPLFKLSLSSLDLSSLKGAGEALDQLGDLMATEAGAARPGEVAERRVRDVPIMEPEHFADLAPAEEGEAAPLPELPSLSPAEGGEELPILDADSLDGGTGYSRHEYAWSGYTYRRVEGLLPLEGGAEPEALALEPLDSAAEKAGRPASPAGKGRKGRERPAGEGPIVFEGGLYRIDSRSPSPEVEVDPELAGLARSVLEEAGNLEHASGP